MIDHRLDKRIDEMIEFWVPKSPVIGSLLAKNRKRYVAAAKAVLAYEKVESFLDWGCGVPVLTALLSDKISECVAYEPYATDVHREFAGANSIEITTSIPADKKFHAIAMVEVIEHIPVLKDVLPRVTDTLAPGGHLVVTTPNGLRLSLWLKYLFRKRADPVPIDKFLSKTEIHWHHQREFTPAELRKTMEYFSLTVDELRVTDISPSEDDYAQSKRIIGEESARKSLKGDLVAKAIRSLSKGSFGPSLISRATLNGLKNPRI